MELLSPRIISETKEQIFISRTSHPHISLSFPPMPNVPFAFFLPFPFAGFFSPATAEREKGQCMERPGQ